MSRKAQIYISNLHKYIDTLHKYIANLHKYIVILDKYIVILDKYIVILDKYIVILDKYIVILDKYIVILDIQWTKRVALHCYGVQLSTQAKGVPFIQWEALAVGTVSQHNIIPSSRTTRS